MSEVIINTTTNKNIVVTKEGNKTEVLVRNGVPLPFPSPGPQGAQGEKGDKGDTGDQGPQGNPTEVNGKTGESITLDKSDIGLGNVDNTSDADKPISTAAQAALDGKAALVHTHAIEDVTGLQTALDGKAALEHTHVIADIIGLQADLDAKQATLTFSPEDSANKQNDLSNPDSSHYPTTQAVSSAIAAKADLVNGKVPLAQINDALIGNVHYKGLYSFTTGLITSDDVTLNGQPLPAAASANTGWYFIAQDTGTVDGTTFILGDWLISNGSLGWHKVDNTDAVSSVNGYTGNVSLNKADIGLGNVPNADATNPANIVQTASYRFATDAEKSTWNTAYSWGNHASAGYLTSASSLAWSKVTGTPSTLSGYGIGDAYPLSGNPSGFLTSASSLAWAKVTGTPNSLAGYAITDAIQNTTSPQPGNIQLDVNGKIGIGASAAVTSLDINTAYSRESLTTVDNSNWSKHYYGRAFGTPGSPSIPTSAVNIGEFSAAVYNGTSYNPAASIVFTMSATPSSTSTPGDIVLSTTPSGTMAVVERMRITSAGRMYVGGTPTSANLSSPNTLAIMANGTGGTATMQNLNSAGFSSIDCFDHTGSKQFTYGWANSGASTFASQIYFNSIASAPFTFNMAGTGILKMFSTGDFVMQNGGTFTDAGYRLDVQGTQRVTGNATFSAFIGINNTSPNYNVDSVTNALGRYQFASGTAAETTQTGLNLQNTTAATSGTLEQDSPAIRLAGTYWDGSASQTTRGLIWLDGNGAGSNSKISIAFRRGPNNWNTVFSVNATGQFESPVKYTSFDSRGAFTLGFEYSNNAAATVGYNQNSPLISQYGTGWKTATTAASQIMSIGQAVSPETGTTNPIGVHKVFFGTNTATPASANELYRVEWGDRLGLNINKQQLAGFLTTINGAATILVGKLTAAASATGYASINIPSGTAPTSPVDGDMWYDGTNLKFRVGGTTKTVTLT